MALLKDSVCPEVDVEVTCDLVSALHAEIVEDLAVSLGSRYPERDRIAADRNHQSRYIGKCTFPLGGGSRAGFIRVVPIACPSGLDAPQTRWASFITFDMPLAMALSAISRNAHGPQQTWNQTCRQVLQPFRVLGVLALVLVFATANSFRFIISAQRVLLSSYESRKFALKYDECRCTATPSADFGSKHACINNAPLAK